MIVVCNSVIENFTIDKQYDVKNMAKYIYDEKGYNRHTYYHIVSDKGILTSVSSNLFIELDQWRENQLNKIL
jgi:hypothetical protein